MRPGSGNLQIHPQFTPRSGLGGIGDRWVYVFIRSSVRSAGSPADTSQRFAPAARASRGIGIGNSGAMQTISNGRTILLGEDEMEVRSYLEMALRCHGYSIESAQDGEEVLSCLERERGRISLVLLDIMMPRKDGLETLREIRRVDRDVPIVMLS